MSPPSGAVQAVHQGTIRNCCQFLTVIFFYTAISHVTSTSFSCPVQLVNPQAKGWSSQHFNIYSVAVLTSLTNPF